MTDLSSGYSQVLKATAGTTTVYYTRGFELISRREGDAASYYLYDGGLSVRALTDEAGAVTDTLVFDAFGNETEKTGTTANTYGFQGEEQDATGLYYLRARYMDPVTGTFTSMDTYAGSLSDPMSLHKYLFANSNPVMYSDPSGHESLTECNTTVAIITILAEVSTGILYYMIGDINGVDKTKPGFWIGMFVAMILAAFLAYFVAGAFVAGVAICAWGKLLLGLMGIIAGGILYKLSNTARVKGYNTYADLFEFASVLLQSYALGEILEGIAEGFQTLKEKVKHAKPQMHNKRGAARISYESTNNTDDDPNSNKGSSKWWHDGYVDDLSDIQILLGVQQSGKGMSTLGSATRDTAISAGKAWVGENYRLITDKNGNFIGYSSEDGMRAFRIQYKPHEGMYRANFQENTMVNNPYPNAGQHPTIIKNVHIDII